MKRIANLESRLMRKHTEITDLKDELARVRRELERVHPTKSRNDERRGNGTMIHR